MIKEKQLFTVHNSDLQKTIKYYTRRSQKKKQQKIGIQKRKIIKFLIENQI